MASGGEQAVLWCGRRELSGKALQSSFQPVRIDRWSFGAGFPRRDLTVSPRQRVRIRGTKMEAITGRRDGYVPAVDLIGLPGIRRLERTAVSYVAFLFERSAEISAYGWVVECPSLEDLHDSEALAGLAEMEKVFPEIGDHLMLQDEVRTNRRR